MDGKMKGISSLVLISVAFTPLLYGERGAGHGGGGGGGHYHGSSGRGAPSRGEHGHWQNHGGTHHGNGHWGRSSWNGHHYNTWYGPYYYGGPGWWAGGLFLVGFTFYTASLVTIASTHTWVVSNDDVDTYNSWPDQNNVSLMEVEGDEEWPYRLCYNGSSCVKARPASGQ